MSAHRRPSIPSTSFLRVALLLAAAALPATGSSTGAPSGPAAVVGSALDRPAVITPLASRSVLLGAAQAGGRVVAVGERGIILLSDDGGGHWAQSPAPVSITLTAVRFADANHGFAVGHAGTVLATADGGKTWERRLDGKRLAQIELDAARARADEAAIKSAQRLVDDGPDKPLLDLAVLGPKRVVVVGAYGIALETLDGGESWRSWRARLPNPRELHLYAVRQRGDRIVVAGEQGLVLASGDRGTSFRRLSLPYNGSFFTAELPSDGAIVVAGLRGNIWLSGDDGGAWAGVKSPVSAAVTGSALGPDGDVSFVNQAGGLSILSQGALRIVDRPPLPPLNGLLRLADGSLLALSIHGAIPLRGKPAVAHAASGSAHGQVK